MNKIFNKRNMKLKLMTEYTKLKPGPIQIKCFSKINFKRNWHQHWIYQSIELATDEIQFIEISEVRAWSKIFSTFFKYKKCSFVWSTYVVCRITHTKQQKQMRTFTFNRSLTRYNYIIFSEEKQKMTRETKNTQT